MSLIGRALRLLFFTAWIPAAFTACGDDGSVNDTMSFAPHCIDEFGDETCAFRFPSKPYCDKCRAASDDQGCAPTPPQTPACTPDPTSGGASVSATDSGSGDPSTSTTTDDPQTTSISAGMTTSGDETTGPSLCAGPDGEVDQECESADPTAPFCVDGVCSGCGDAGGDDFCRGYDPVTPACSEADGICIGCGDAGGDFSCGEATPLCDTSGACVACRSHDDCPATACHLDPSDPLLGTCFAEDERIWVDNGQVCPGQGTQVSPNCSLSNAVASIDEGDNAVILVAGTGTPYEENAVFDVAATIAVIGTSGPRVTGQTAVFDPTIAVEAGTVYIEGLRVSQNGSHHGMTCSDATLWLQSVDFGTNDQYGFYGVGPCQVRMEATSVHHNRRGGVRMLGGKLVMHNTSIGENGDGAGGPGLLVQFAEVDVVYATIVANEGSGGNDNIGCMMATGSIRNSAIVGTATPSVALDCFTLSYDNNASDSNNSTGPGGFLVTETYNSLWFQNPSVGDFRLGAAPLTPFVDVALWQEGDPPVDADGTPRPMGDVAGYAGVDEPDP